TERHSRSSREAGNAVLSVGERCPSDRFGGHRFSPNRIRNRRKRFFSSVAGRRYISPPTEQSRDSCDNLADRGEWCSLYSRRLELRQFEGGVELALSPAASPRQQSYTQLPPMGPTPAFASES